MTDIEIRPSQPGEPGPERVPLPAVPAESSYEIDLDPEPPAVVAVPVEAVPAVPVAGERLPVLPDFLRGTEGLKRGARRAGGRAWHGARYHGLRSPVYLAAALFWALVGAARLAGAWLRWWLWPVPVEAHTTAAQDGWRAWKSLHAEHKRTAKTRAWISLAVGLPLLLGALALWRFAPWWAWPPIALALLAALARAGRPAGRRIIAPATVTPRFRRLSADVVVRAYAAAGLCNPDKPGQQLAFGSPMARDGEGSRVVIDLPYGLGLADAVAKRDKIASGLDVQVSQVFLHRDPTSNRRHVLWVADRDPLAVPVGRTPLLAGRATDIWRPAPLGLDERGQLVSVPLVWNSVLVGALPRQGKTFAARLMALYAALDPFVTLDVFDGKGSPDWRAFSLVADSFAYGLTPTKDGLPPEILLATLERIKADVQDRYARLSELAAKRPGLCPEGKLTRELSRDPRFGMPVRLLVIDEAQEYYDLGDISKEIAALLVFLVKVAPGAGVSVIAATQKPSGIGGSGAVSQQFVSFRDQMQIRLSLRTSSWQVSEMVLGQGAYSEGLDSSTLLPQYKGVGILRGASDASPTVRTYLADGQDAERILTAARTLRERAGTLSGMAAGAQAANPARDVLADVLAVFASDTGLHWQVLAARLATRFPDRWADATADAISAQCRALGVPSVDVKQFGKTLKGCRCADVDAATRSR